jgi:hypothetical protein
MKFAMEIQLGNEAMKDGDHIARALRLVAGALTDGAPEELYQALSRGEELLYRICDVNGNVVGGWSIEYEAHEDPRVIPHG